ncbi:MAG: DUF6281 family protein [Marmoricola sp.]
MRPPRSRVTVLGVTAVLLVTSACGTAGGGGAAGSCAGVVVRAGVTYLPWGIDRVIPTTGRVLTARMPACDDTPRDDDPGVPASTVRVRAIDGVPPGDALWALDGDGGPGHHLLYVRRGFLREGETIAHAARRLLTASVKTVTPSPSAS